MRSESEMNIIQIAREAKLDQLWGDDPLSDWSVELTRFATLVADAEREACAQVCERLATWDTALAIVCADAIRARGEE